ncbi:MAG: hypothetical protein ACLR39_02760, partial [Oscillospiraceae bacterium]
MPGASPPLVSTPMRFTALSIFGYPFSQPKLKCSKRYIHDTTVGGDFQALFPDFAAGCPFLTVLFRQAVVY